MPELSTLEWIGDVRGPIIAYGLQEATSGAKSIAITVHCEEYWDTDTSAWVKLEGNFKAEGNLWIIKKDGKLNENPIQSLMEHAGWDGDLTAIVQGTWKPSPVSVTIGEDKYKDEVRYRIQWMNGYGRQPVGVSNVSVDKAKAIQAQYGGQFRALLGNLKRPATAPASSAPPTLPPRQPPPPPAPAPKPISTMTQEEIKEEAKKGDGSPF